MKPKPNDKIKHEKKVSVTTYKPTFQFIKDIYSSDDVTANEAIPTVEISKLNGQEEESKEVENSEPTTLVSKESQTEKVEVSPGDYDLGTGSPDPTIDNLYSTEPTTVKAEKPSFSFMDYLFGTTSEDDTKVEAKNVTSSQLEIEITTELAKLKVPTTENTFMPDELTETQGLATETIDVKKINATTTHKVSTTPDLPKFESSSQSSFMNPANVISTSMSTEISHETEICFRGKCIKNFKDVI